MKKTKENIKASRKKGKLCGAGSLLNDLQCAYSHGWPQIIDLLICIDKLAGELLYSVDYPEVHTEVEEDSCISMMFFALLVQQRQWMW